MTQRPVFIPQDDESTLVVEQSFSFAWSGGFAPSQKRKNIVALHAAARQAGLSPVLEVSTKSDSSLGQSLSAFNLLVPVSRGRSVSVEVAYQASKVFAHGGPFLDLLEREPREAKRDARLQSSGALVSFQFGGLSFPLRPLSAFYDWLYLRALTRHPILLQGLADYAGFTDIEFNPAKSISCQARSCAIAVALMQSDALQASARHFAIFLEHYRTPGMDTSAAESPTLEI